MTRAAADLLETRKGRGAVAAAIVALFVGLRLALAGVRWPFYDELFTRWVSRKPLAGILDALRHDSGPPLYYFIVHLIPYPRAVSFAASCVALAFVLAAKRLGPARFTAAALLAVFPPSVLLSADGRAYALCAMFVTIGVLALAADRPWLAAIAFVLGAYSHFYGAFFFPLLLPRRCVVTTLLFIPGLLLALRQPPEAIGWMLPGRYPAGLFSPIPLPLVILAALLVVVAVVRDRRNRFAVMTLVPVALVIAFSIAGRRLYVPLRFESILAPPLALWIATASEAWSPRIRRPLVAGLALLCLFVTALGIADSARRAPDPYSVAAARVEGPVVASGYMFLEVAASRDDVEAFPRDQAIHPGWRATLPANVLRGEIAALPPDFIWTGERGAPELVLLGERYQVRPLYANEAAVIARMHRR